MLMADKNVPPPLLPAHIEATIHLIARILRASAEGLASSACDRARNSLRWATPIRGHTPPGRAGYNLDTLWARMVPELDEAKLVQLDRLRIGNLGFSLRETFEQIGNAGPMIVRGTHSPLNM